MSATPSNGLPQDPTPGREPAPQQPHGNQPQNVPHGSGSPPPNQPPRPPANPLDAWASGPQISRTGSWRSLQPGASMIVAVTQVPFPRWAHKDHANHTRPCAGDGCAHCASGARRELRYLVEIVEPGDPSTRRVWDATAGGAAALQQAAANAPLSTTLFRIVLQRSYSVSVAGTITPELAATIARLPAHDLATLARQDRGATPSAPRAPAPAWGAQPGWATPPAWATPPGGAWPAPPQAPTPPAPVTWVPPAAPTPPPSWAPPAPPAPPSIPPGIDPLHPFGI